MCSIRSRLIVLERRTMPCTVYPFSSRNSARYEPSCPVIPVISAERVMAESLPVRDEHPGEHSGGGLVDKRGSKQGLRSSSRPSTAAYKEMRQKAFRRSS